MMEKVRINTKRTYIAKKKAFDYQQEAVDEIKDLEYAAVFHEQGLGKTKIAIDLLLYWIKNKSVEVVLIVTKKQLVSNWIVEIKEHADIVPVVLNNDKRNNYYVFNGKSRVIITNFETLVTEKKRFNLYLDILDVGIIVDESVKLKNPNSNLTKTYFDLREKFAKRVIMTGTPIANRPYDIWSQVFFLDGGKSLGKDYKTFKKEYDLTNELYKDRERIDSFEGNLQGLYNKIDSFSVRETKNSGIISLPKKKYINVTVEFEEEQLEMYETIRKEMVIILEKDDKSILDDSSAILKRLLRLVQVTSNPKLLNDLYGEISSKEKELDILIKQIIERKEKCIVWSNYIENIDYFKTKYNSIGSVKIHGKMTIEDRVKSVERFKNDDNVSVLFATPQAAKEGLTLTEANNVIFYDRSFSLDDYLQAQDRIHRISQTKVCNVYNLIVRGSIDEWIDVLLQAKEWAAKLGQGDISLEEYKKHIDYSFGDIIREIIGGN